MDSTRTNASPDLFTSFKLVNQGAPATTPKHQQDRYKLWHRRLAHLGPQKVRNLHKVTNIVEPIQVNEKLHICDVCSQTKIRNQTNTEVRSRKETLWDLLSIDIAGPFPQSLTGNRYFLEIIDSHSKRTWIYPVKSWTDAPRVLQIWRREVELEAGNRLKAVRSDNAPELKGIIDRWHSESGVQPQYTVPYRSHQNGAIERAIQTTENSVRAMIKESGLLLKFWDEAAKTDAYLRNRCDTGPELECGRINPEEAWTGIRPSIDLFVYGDASVFHMLISNLYRRVEDKTSSWIEEELLCL